MKYDKNSFLAGISVGMTLKGWASGDASFGGGGGRVAEIIPVTNYAPQFRVSIALDNQDIGLVTDYSKE
nr:MAG TPA: hypothetical protein [Caudoviricetes sp.]